MGANPGGDCGGALRLIFSEQSRRRKPRAGVVYLDTEPDCVNKWVLSNNPPRSPVTLHRTAIIKERTSSTPGTALTGRFRRAERRVVVRVLCNFLHVLDVPDLVVRVDYKYRPAFDTKILDQGPVTLSK